MARVRKRETTESVAVIFTHTESKDLNEWDVEGIDRKRGVNGHGAHYLVMRDGEIVKTRDPDSFGNIDDAFDDEAVYVRVVASPDTMTEEQETELDYLLASLESAYGANTVYLPEIN